MVFVLCSECALNLLFLPRETTLEVTLLLFLFTLSFLLCLQASLKDWLGFDNYIRSIRKSTEGFEGMMKGLDSSESGGGVMPGVKFSDITFAGIPVRVYEPPAGGEGHLRRGLMFFHGGGWALGSASEYGRHCFLKVKLRRFNFFNHLIANFFALQVQIVPTVSIIQYSSFKSFVLC